MPTTVGRRLAGAPNTHPGGAGRMFLNAGGRNFLLFLSCLDLPSSQPSPPAPVASLPGPPYLPGPGRRAGRSYCKTAREGAVIFCQHFCQHRWQEKPGNVTCDTPQGISMSCLLSSMVCTTRDMARLLGNAAAFPRVASRHNFFNR